MQYRLSTLLLAFVVVWASLAVFGAAGGIVVAAILLVIAALVRSPELRKHAPPSLLVVLLGGLCLAGLLLPGTQSGPPSRWTQCKLNIMQIGMALLSYEQANGRFPPAVVTDKHGNAMHSWRTLILPNLDQLELYHAYNFREPWNGPNNSKLSARCLDVYCCPSDSSIGGRPMTSYVAVTGPGTVWDQQRPTETPPRVMVVELVDSGIPWAEPRDITLDEACRGVGEGTGPRTLAHTSVFDTFFFQEETIAYGFILLSDGSVHSIPIGLPPETLRGLFASDGKAWSACEAFSPVRQPRGRRINWTNCTAPGGAHPFLRGPAVSPTG